MSRIRVFVKRSYDLVGAPLWIDPLETSFSDIVDGPVGKYDPQKGKPDIWILFNREAEQKSLPHNMDLFGEKFYGTLVFTGIRNGSYASFPGTLSDYRRRILGGEG